MTLTFDNGNSASPASNPLSNKSVTSGMCGHLAESPEMTICCKIWKDNY
jgi:hypothetical protein